MGLRPPMASSAVPGCRQAYTSMPCHTALDAAVLAIWESYAPADPGGVIVDSSAVVGESAARESAC